MTSSRRPKNILFPFDAMTICHEVGIPVPPSPPGFATAIRRAFSGDSRLAQCRLSVSSTSPWLRAGK